ncbi:MAG: ArsR/SmtB family transcription factor [bacterium]
MFRTGKPAENCEDVTMKRDEVIEISKALADETRYNILREIPADGEKCCKDLSDCFNISKATVTHHINKLSELGLVDSKREQTYHYLRRNQKKIERYRKLIEEDFEL